MPDNEKTYLTGSLSSFADGMMIPQDIYAANRDILLIRAGTVLDTRKLEALRRINNYEDLIYIAFETPSQMHEFNLSCKIINQVQLEEESGYAEIKDMASHLLDDIVTADVIEYSRANEMSEELCDRLENTSQDVIISLINSLGPIDEYLPRHCVEVGMLCGLLGRWLGFVKGDVDNLVTTGLLHDCGKASVPAQILGAPRKLTNAEFEIIKMHTVYSYDMLGNFPEFIRKAARYHHERIDGRGYPDKLRSDDIPTNARITAICDIYDAMVSRRSYKKEFNPFLVLKTLSSMRTIELDTLFVDIFVKNMLGELIEKPVILSSGDIAVVCENDPNDIEFPYVRTQDGIIKTDINLRCVSLYFDDTPS